MIVLAILTALLMLVALVSLINVANDLRTSNIPLYEVAAAAAGGAELQRDSPTTAALTLTVCVDDTTSHVSMLAQEWSGLGSFPGAVRIFTASPGCHPYQFAELPLPPKHDNPDGECAPWAISGVILPSDVNRPGESFSTTALCIEDIPTPALTPAPA